MTDIVFAIDFHAQLYLMGKYVQTLLVIKECTSTLFFSTAYVIASCLLHHLCCLLVLRFVVLFFLP